MSQQLKEIQQTLSAKASKSNSEFFLRMVPGQQKIYGVKTPDLNLLVQQYKTGSFELTTELWESGALEEKIIAIKIMEKMGKQDPGKLLSLFKKFSNQVDNWAVC
ncbi:MAG TPA: DNA alkylation repair protein, partial [Chitinophagaceae bacterium]|nr:DNA alkylation repair protein [Chitinophagaceae bacterium]